MLECVCWSVCVGVCVLECVCWSVCVGVHVLDDTSQMYIVYSTPVITRCKGCRNVVVRVIVYLLLQSEGEIIKTWLLETFHCTFYSCS